MRALWKGLTPFAVHLTLKYALRMGTNAMYQSLLRDEVRAPQSVSQLTPICLTSMHLQRSRHVTAVTGITASGPHKAHHPVIAACLLMTLICYTHRPASNHATCPNHSNDQFMNAK